MKNKLNNIDKEKLAVAVEDVEIKSDVTTSENPFEEYILENSDKLFEGEKRSEIRN